MKIFVSIPMTGVEHTVMQRYKNAESFIKNDPILSKYEIVTPYKFFEYFDNKEIDLSATTDMKITAFCMGKDVQLVIGCDAIYSCKGWETSKGCRVERATAEIYGLKLFNET